MMIYSHKITAVAFLAAAAFILSAEVPPAQAARPYREGERSVVEVPSPRRRAVRSVGSYIDRDRDGYGNRTTAAAPTDPLAVSNNSDCNDNDPKIWRSVVGGTDYDFDGYILEAAVSTECAGAAQTHNSRTYYFKHWQYAHGFWFLAAPQVLGYNDANDGNPDRH